MIREKDNRENAVFRCSFVHFKGDNRSIICWHKDNGCQVSFYLMKELSWSKVICKRLLDGMNIASTPLFKGIARMYFSYFICWKFISLLAWLTVFENRFKQFVNVISQLKERVSSLLLLFCSFHKPKSVLWIFNVTETLSDSVPLKIVHCSKQGYAWGQKRRKNINAILQLFK